MSHSRNASTRVIRPLPVEDTAVPLAADFLLHVRRGCRALELHIDERPSRDTQREPGDVLVDLRHHTDAVLQIPLLEVKRLEALDAFADGEVIVRIADLDPEPIAQLRILDAGIGAQHELGYRRSMARKAPRLGLPAKAQVVAKIAAGSCYRFGACPGFETGA